MSFLVNLETMKPQDRILAERAASVVRVLPRPMSPHIMEVHEHELLGWQDLLLEDLLLRPSSNISAGQVALMSAEGYGYLFPLLLALGLMLPSDDFHYEVAAKFVTSKWQMQGASDNYLKACQSLADRWKDECGFLENPHAYVDRRDSLTLEELLNNCYERSYYGEANCTAAMLSSMYHGIKTKCALL